MAGNVDAPDGPRLGDGSGGSGQGPPSGDGAAAPEAEVDAFVSYSHDDQVWVTKLVENLEHLGVRVFFDEWDILPGEVFVHRLDEGLRTAKAGILVVSPASIASRWAQNEYAAMLGNAVEHGRPLIPVLLADAEMPSMLAIRQWVDFRDARDPVTYQARVARLVNALRARRPPRGRSSSPGSRTGDGADEKPDRAPAGLPFHAEGTRTAVLRISPRRVVLTGPAGTVDGEPAGLDWSALQPLRELHRRRTRRSSTASLVLRAPTAGATTAADPLDRALRDVGRMLGERFLPDGVAAALAEELAAAVHRGEPLELALEISDDTGSPGSTSTSAVDTAVDAAPDAVTAPAPSASEGGSVLADLPWETLTLPGDPRPLVLHPSVLLHRVIGGLGSTPAMGIPGPLRILAVIASPERGGGELLDYERELERILDAVAPARQRGGAYVRVLNWGSKAAIRAALRQERFHVLHLSCHARPGELLLEDENGSADGVDAKTFAEDVLVPGSGVPLVVLAGCSTALDVAAGGTTPTTPTTPRPAEAGDEAGGSPKDDRGAAGGAALPGLARGLLAHGVPSVLAMTAPVTDLYATDLASRFYAELSGRQKVDPLAALADARRAVEAKRAALSADDRRAALAEWATPALFLRGPSIPLYNPSDDFEKIVEPAEPMLAEGIVVRRVGEFVGRRAELRALVRVLRCRDQPPDGTARTDVSGVVLHGIGGVGKSTLSAQLITDLGADAGLVVSLTSAATQAVTVDQILLAIAQRLSSWCLAKNIGIDDLRRRMVDVLRSGQAPWTDRLALLAEHVMARLPVTLLLDNAEDLLVPDGAGAGQRFTDDQIADFIAAWVALPHGARLIVTSRFPLPVSERTTRRLAIHHLGPLSRAESRKLLWRLPALDALSPAEQDRAITDVGGHPRTLEYLDALLRRGTTRFPDLAERLERILTDRGIPDPSSWLAAPGRTLDQALAESVTLAVDDVLLRRLLERLRDVPLARQLLVGASVYRLPVDEHGLAWQVSERASSPAPDPAKDAALAEVIRLIRESQARGATSLDEAGLSAEQARLYLDEIEHRRRPPIGVPAEFEVAAHTLLDLGLLSPTAGEGDQSAFTVHRWTAGAVLAETGTEAVTDAHRRAAAYWRWRVDVWPQDRLADITQLLEAGHHFLAAGDLDDIEATIGTACLQLDTWGLWDWEERACQDVLAQAPPVSRLASTFVHELGIIAQRRGDYAAAEARYQQSLTILEELGNRAGIASSTSQIGVLYTEMGRSAEAVPYNLASLAIRVEIGSPEARINVHWLGRQRKELGVELFLELLAEHLAPADVDVVQRLLAEAKDEDQRSS